MMPQLAFHLLVLVELKIQINQVNSGLPERLDIIRAINSCCGIIQELRGQMKETLFKRVMQAMTMWLKITISPSLEE